MRGPPRQSSRSSSIRTAVAARMAAQLAMPPDRAESDLTATLSPSWGSGLCTEVAFLWAVGDRCAASLTPEVLMTHPHDPHDVAGTRRDEPRPGRGAPGPAAVPAQTHRDPIGGSPAGPAATYRDGPAAGGTAGLPVLPADVAARYRPVRLLARQGAEADVFLVTDEAGAEWVLKVYRRDIAPDPEVWAALKRTRSRHLVSVRETGSTGDGRKFEIMEFLGGGDLRDVNGHRALDPATLTDVVAQLADGLAALHAVHIIHRDLKPENVLVRQTRPMELVLTDFGLSRRLDHTSVYSTAARTLLYTAPETFSNHLSPARDWWSLGMIVRELATGERPFVGWAEEVIMTHLITRPIDLSGVADPRIALLCRGLLVRDHQQRWVAEQVRQWLAGGSPPVPEDVPPPAPTTGAIKPLALWGTAHPDPVVLAAALEARWADAARTFFALPNSERWKALKDWLARFDDTLFYRGEDRQDLCDELDASPWPPDAKLTRLLTLLDPARPPSYRGVRLSSNDLATVTTRAANDDEECLRVVDDLWTEHLLPVLAQRLGGGDLAVIDSRWRARQAAYERASAEVVRDHPGLQETLGDAVTRRQARAATLNMAAVGGVVEGALDDLVHQLQRQLPRRIDWFDHLVAWRGGDPARSLAVFAAASAAQAQAQRMVRDEQAAHAAQQNRQMLWDRKEAGRIAGRGTALGHAAGGAAVLFVLWFVFLVLGGAPAAGGALLVFLIQAGIEIGLASGMGSDYHPQYSLLRGLGRTSSRVGDSLRDRPGIGCLGIIAVLVGLPYLTQALPWTVPLLVLIVHIGWAVHRQSRWKQFHEHERRTALGGAW
jgi:tRNA A-37 threonylcarbamoyl transferase component Bud32